MSFQPHKTAPLYFRPSKLDISDADENSSVGSHKNEPIRTHSAMQKTLTSCSEALKAHLESLVPLVAKLNNKKQFESSESGEPSSVEVKPKRCVATRCGAMSIKSWSKQDKHARFEEAVIGTQVFYKLDRLYTTAQRATLKDESILLLNSGNVSATVVAKFSSMLIIQLYVIDAHFQMSPAMFYAETTSTSSSHDLSEDTLRDMKHSTFIRDREQFAALQELCRESHRAVDFTPTAVKVSRPIAKPFVIDHSTAGISKPLWAPPTVPPAVVTQCKPLMLVRNATEETSTKRRLVCSSSSSDSEEGKIKYHQMTAKRLKQSISSLGDASTVLSNNSQTVSTSHVTSTDIPTTGITHQMPLKYSTMTKKHSSKFVHCALGETVSLRLACLYSRSELGEMEPDEQQVLRFTTVDATVVDKSCDDCVVRIEGLSGVHIRLNPIRFEQNVNLIRRGEDRVHHTASDLINLPEIDKDEFKMIMCLIEQSSWFVKTYEDHVRESITSARHNPRNTASEDSSSVQDTAAAAAAAAADETSGLSDDDEEAIPRLTPLTRITSSAGQRRTSVAASSSVNTITTNEMSVV